MDSIIRRGDTFWSHWPYSKLIICLLSLSNCAELFSDIIILFDTAISKRMRSWMVLRSIFNQFIISFLFLLKAFDFVLQLIYFFKQYICYYFVFIFTYSANLACIHIFYLLVFFGLLWFLLYCGERLCSGNKSARQDCFLSNNFLQDNLIFSSRNLNLYRLVANLLQRKIIWPYWFIVLLNMVHLKNPTDRKMIRCCTKIIIFLLFFLLILLLIWALTSRKSIFV